MTAAEPLVPSRDIAPPTTIDSADIICHGWRVNQAAGAVRVIFRYLIILALDALNAVAVDIALHLQWFVEYGT